MFKPIRTLVAGGTLLAAGLSCTGSAVAQDFPTRPIRVIAASSAGGLSDIFMRVLGEELRKSWGQPVVVENRPGGSFNVATRACAEATPDGYTICILPGEAVTQNQFLFKTLGFDPEADLAPITNLFIITQVLSASPALGVKTIGELRALAASKRTALSYTAPGLSHVLFLEKLKEETGADVVKIGFKGGSDAVGRLLSGEVPLLFVGAGNLISALNDGKVNPLVVDSATRSPLLPNVPTLREVGWTGDVTQSYFGLFAPIKTPKPIVRKISDEANRIVATPAIRDTHLVARGLEPAVSPPEQFEDFLRKDRAANARVVKASGLELQ